MTRDSLFEGPFRGVRARLRDANLTALNENFPTPEFKAYYLAHVIETHSCWPRVLDGTMEQGRYHERTKRMMEAILRAVIKPEPEPIRPGDIIGAGWPVEQRFRGECGA